MPDNAPSNFDDESILDLLQRLLAGGLSDAEEQAINDALASKAAALRNPQPMAAGDQSLGVSLLDEPKPFTEAIDHVLSKRILPTTLSSADLRQLSANVRRQSLFSARNNLEGSLESLKDSVVSILNPQTVQRADRVTSSNPQGNVTVGANLATAKADLLAKLKELGYRPDPEHKDTIKDLTSDARLDFTIRTNVQLGQGAGQFVRANADAELVELYPAWELVRFEPREVPRGFKRSGKGLIPVPNDDWPSRFEAAAAESGDDRAASVLAQTGRMVALKSSPLWQALGNGAGGKTDTLGNPYPPFAFNSGFWVEDVDKVDAQELGLLQPGEVAAPATFDFGSLFQPPAQPA